MLKRKDLLGLIDLTKEELTEILDVAADMKRHLKDGDKQLPYLKGKTATILFYENSTRTRTSFELAANTLVLRSSILRLARLRLPRGKRSWIRGRPWTRSSTTF